MSRALVLLTWLRTVASWRAFWRSGRGSPVAFLGRLLIVVLMLAPAVGWVAAVLRSFTVQNDPLTAWLRSAVREATHVAPLPLLLFLILVGILAALTKPFRFSPTEVDFLFAGPFRRHQLLNYKLGAAFSGHVLVSFLVAAPLGTGVSGLIPVFVASLLMFNFLHLFSLVAGLLGMTLGFHDSRAPRRLSFAFALLFGTLAILWFRFGKSLVDPIAIYRQLEHSLLWRVATLPVRGFVEAGLAQSIWPDLVEWSSLCLLVNGLLFVTLHKLDARLEERAEQSDGRTADLDAERPASKRTPWTLPLLSRCQGMGPVAWRQSMNVVRNPQLIAVALSIYGMLVFMLFTLSVGGSAILFLPTLDGHVEINPAAAWVCGGIVIAIAMFLSSGLSLDFRGDMGQIDVLKTLPIEPIVLVAGQLLVPVVIAAVLQWLVMAAMAIALRNVPAGLWVAAAFGPLINVVLIAIENLLTLWFPMRPTPGTTPEPFELIGHALFRPVLKTASASAAVFATVVVSVGAYFVFGQSVIAALAAAWLTLAACGSGLVVLVAYVFDRFDVAGAVSA
jgi:hypothetical protein